jgi:hypothetical protein
MNRNNNPVENIVASQVELKEMVTDLRNHFESVLETQNAKIERVLETQQVFLETLTELTRQLEELNDRRSNINLTSNSYNHSNNNNNNSNNNNIDYNNNYSSSATDNFSKEDEKELKTLLSSIINDITMTSYCYKKFSDLLDVR